MSTTDATWTGVVLAGGRSSRMGRDKAMLPWQGLPLIEHAMELLTQAGAARVVVSGDYPRYAGIVDSVPGCGPLGGLSSAAAQLPDGNLLVLPVDMPCLSVRMLRALVEAPAAAGVHFHGQMLPMRMHLDTTSRACLSRLLAAGPAQRSLRALQQELGFLQIDAAMEDMPALLNCNTPQQWEQIAT